MGWIITALANLALETVNDLLVWSIGLCNSLQIDIGYDPSSSADKLFDPKYFKPGPGNDKYLGLFDKIFPAASNFFEVFIILAYLLIIISVLYKLYQGFLGPLTNAEHPVSVTVRGLIAAFLVTWSYDLFILSEKIMNKMYMLFKSVFDFIVSGSGFDDGTSDNVFNMVSPINNDEFFKNQADMKMSSDFAMIILIAIFFTGLVISFMKLLIEIYMRYVVLGVLFYTCPLAFCTLATESTSDIFRSWFKMVVSQFLLMFLNLFFMTVFTSSMSNIFIRTKSEHYVFIDEHQFVQTMLLLIAWLVIGQKADEHLRSLGLSASQTGSSLASAIIAGASTANAAFHIGKGLAHTGASAAGKVADKISSSDTGQVIQGSMGSVFGGGAAATIANAERENGKLTTEGAKQILNAQGGYAKGQDAKEATSALGIDPSNTFGEKSNMIDWNQSEVGNNTITLKDGNGNTIGQLGNAAQYDAGEGFATKTIQTEGGLMAYSATNDIVNTDANSIMNDLSNSAAEYSNDAGITWTSNNDGTLSGLDSNGNIKYQASADYLAQVDPNKGKTFTGKSGNVPYTVQKLDGSDSKPGFASVKKSATSPMLDKKKHPNANSNYNKGNSSYDTFRKSKKRK